MLACWEGGSNTIYLIVSNHNGTKSKSINNASPIKHWELNPAKVTDKDFLHL